MQWDESDSAKIGIPVAFFVVGVSALLWFWPRPAQMFLNGDRKTAKVVEVRDASHNTKRIRLFLGSRELVLGLPVGKHIVVYAPNPSSCLESGRWNGDEDSDKGRPEIERRYTPISNDSAQGYAELLVKIYRPGTVRLPGGEEKTFEDGGKMSLFLDQLKPGDYLDLSGPLGNIEYLPGGFFKLPSRTVQKQHVAMIAGGTGITPMLQILRVAMRESRKTSRYTLLFANKTERDIFAQDIIQELEQDSDGYLKVHLALEMAPPGWKGKAGMVSAEMLRETLPPAARAPLILLCGPQGMIDSCKANLELLGYKKDIVVF